jgi:hypothetical protein
LWIGFTQVSVGNFARYTSGVSQIDPTFTIIGRVGGPTDGLEIRAELDQDALKGRVGGIFGKDLNLAITETGVHGQVGGSKGFLVSLELRGGELSGAVGNESLVVRGVDQVTGRLGDTIGGLEISARQRGSKLTGRLGGLTGKMIDLELGSAPGWIGVLTAVVALYALERHSVR